MTLRSTRETIDDLRQLLKEFDQPQGSDLDPVALKDLKHIVLNRIAELEIAETRELPEAGSRTASHRRAA